jgi:hypothetical protein
MKVRCERLLSPTTGVPIERSPLLTVGREYLVLSVIAQPGTRILLRLIDDEGRSPSLWDARMFTTTSTRIPPNWGIRLGEDGVLTIEPTKWLHDGFWERYFDGDMCAVAEFDAGLKLLRDQSE